jgi:hypothetical protein
MFHFLFSPREGYPPFCPRILIRRFLPDQAFFMAFAKMEKYLGKLAVDLHPFSAGMAS